MNDPKIMKQKISLLIVFASVVFLTLLTMQFNLVRSSYQYKVVEFQTEVKDKIAHTTHNFTDVDSTVLNSKDLYYDNLIGHYIKNKNFKAQLKARLLSSPQKTVLNKLLMRKLQLEFPEETIDFAVVTNKFIIFDSTQKADTIFSEKPVIENTAYGNLTSLEDAFAVRNYVGSTNGISNPGYKLLTEDTLFVSVKNWKWIIWQRMSLVLLMALASTAILIYLFVMLVKTLLKQKKATGIKIDLLGTLGNELLNRSQTNEVNSAESDPSVIQIGKYLFDSKRYELRFENQKQQLTEKETSLLIFLYQHKNKLVKREQILKAVWGNEDYFTGRSMDVFISKLRKYFADDHNIAIESIRNIGLEFKVKGVAK